MSGHDSDVIALDLFRKRRAETLSGAERIEVRGLLSEFDAYRAGCPTARREASGAAASDRSGPLTSEEVQDLRTMLLEFDAITRSCPVARRLAQG